MKIDANIVNLIAELEFLIGSECYNPNSYDGWNDIEGCDYRYPVNVPIGNGKYVKVRSNINESILLSKEDISSSSIEFMKYKFGANELFIGQGLIHTLEFLENRYGISFTELENQLTRF